MGASPTGASLVSTVHSRSCSSAATARNTRPEPSGYLVSPYAGQGIASNRIQQYFLLAIKDGKKKPEEWVDFAWKKMSEQNIRVTQNNETIEDEKKNREVLGEQAALFHETGVPLLRAHKII